MRHDSLQGQINDWQSQFCAFQHSSVILLDQSMACHVFHNITGWIDKPVLIFWIAQRNKFYPLLQIERVIYKRQSVPTGAWHLIPYSSSFSLYLWIVLSLVNVLSMPWTWDPKILFTYFQLWFIVVRNVYLTSLLSNWWTSSRLVKVARSNQSIMKNVDLERWFTIPCPGNFKIPAVPKNSQSRRARRHHHWDWFRRLPISLSPSAAKVVIAFRIKRPWCTYEKSKQVTQFLK